MWNLNPTFELMTLNNALLNISFVPPSPQDHFSQVSDQLEQYEIWPDFWPHMTLEDATTDFSFLLLRITSVLAQLEQFEILPWTWPRQANEHKLDVSRTKLHPPTKFEDGRTYTSWRKAMNRQTNKQTNTHSIIEYRWHMAALLRPSGCQPSIHVMEHTDSANVGFNIFCSKEHFLSFKMIPYWSKLIRQSILFFLKSWFLYFLFSILNPHVLCESTYFKVTAQWYLRPLRKDNLEM